MRKILLSLTLIAISQLVFAQATVRWDGGGDGTDWNDPLNWDSDSIPVAGDFVEFASDATVTGSKPPAPRRIDILAGGHTVTFNLDLDIGDGVIEEHALKIQNNSTLNLGTAGANRVFNIQVGGNKEAILQNANPGPTVLNISLDTTLTIVKARYGIWAYNGTNTVNNAGTINISGTLQDGTRIDTGSFTNEASGIVTITDPGDDGVNLSGSGSFTNNGALTISLPEGAGTGKNNILAETGSVFTNNAQISMLEGNDPRRIVVSGGEFLNNKDAIMDLGNGRFRNEVGGTFTNNGLVVSSFLAGGVPAAAVFGTADAGTSTNNAFYNYNDDGSLDFGGGTGIVNNGVNINSDADMTVNAANSCSVNLGIATAYDWFDDSGNNNPVGSNDAAGDISFSNDAFSPAASHPIFTVYGTEVEYTIENLDGDCIDIPQFTVGGSATGISVGSITIQNNNSDDITLSADDSFTFPPQDDGSTYSVTVSDKPESLDCAVSGGSNNDGTGTLSGANVNNILVACTPVPTYSIGGTINGLTDSLTVQNNGADDLLINADASSFTFATELPQGATYDVTILVQPNTQVCSVQDGTGSGTVGDSNVTSVVIDCVDVIKYSVGGNLTNLANGESVTLENNQVDELVLDADGLFTFAVPLAQGENYNVAVTQQPVTQDCAVTNGSGTMPDSDINNVAVNCVDVPTYTIGGSISGLNGEVILTNNGGDDLLVSNNGTFEFSTPLKSSDPYFVRVETRPIGQICQIISGGSGVVNDSNVTDVLIECEDSQLPPQSEFAIPTLSNWSLLLLVLTLGLLAFTQRRHN